MANTKSALKEIRKNRRRYLRNKAIRSALKTYIKKLKVSIDKKDLKEAQNLLPEVYSRLDKCAKKNIIHWKKAARFKSRLMAKLNELKKQKSTEQNPSQSN
jgi:small subunit ribosomal protein S20